MAFVRYSNRLRWVRVRSRKVGERIVMSYWEDVFNTTLWVLLSISVLFLSPLIILVNAVRWISYECK